MTHISMTLATATLTMTLAQGAFTSTPVALSNETRFLMDHLVNQLRRA